MADATRLRAILELVEESLDEPDIDGAGLAGRAYLSRYHFDRLVHAVLGKPPGAFRRRLLLERAACRLVTAADKVIEIALEAVYAQETFIDATCMPPQAFSLGGVLAHVLTFSAVGAPWPSARWLAPGSPISALVTRCPT